MLNIFRRKNKKQFFRNMKSCDINMEQLKNKQINGIKIIDVRSSQEYNEWHIEGAINIPEYEINCNVDNILENKNEDIVLYCSSGSRSEKAYSKLTKLGYKRLYCLYGGLDNY